MSILVIFILVFNVFTLAVYAQKPSREEEELKKEFDELKKEYDTLLVEHCIKGKFLRLLRDLMWSHVKKEVDELPAELRGLRLQLENLDKKEKELHENFERNLKDGIKKIMRGKFPELRQELAEQVVGDILKLVVEKVFEEAFEIIPIFEIASIFTGVVKAAQATEEEKKKLLELMVEITNFVLKETTNYAQRLKRIYDWKVEIARQLEVYETYERVITPLEEEFWKQHNELSKKRKVMIEIDMKLNPEKFAPVYTLPPEGQIEKKLRELKNLLRVSEQPPSGCALHPPDFWPFHIKNREIGLNILELTRLTLGQLKIYTTEEREKAFKDLLRDILEISSYDIENPQIKIELLGLLKHSDPDVRGYAALSLYPSSDKDVWKALVDNIYHDSSSQVRSNSILALNPERSESIEILRWVYQHDASEDVKGAALIKLSEFTQYDMAINQLIDVIKSGTDASNRAIAVMALGIGSSGIKKERITDVQRALSVAETDDDKLVGALAKLSLKQIEIFTPPLYHQLAIHVDTYNQNIGQVLGIVKMLFGNERINAYIKNGEEESIGIVMQNAKIIEFKEGKVQNPTMRMYTDKDTIHKLMEDPSFVLEALDKGKIKCEGIGIIKQAKVFAITVGIKICRWFERLLK